MTGLTGRQEAHRDSDTVQRFLGLAIMFHRYYDISCFLSCFNISCDLDNLLQGVTSINDRFIPSCLNQLFKKDYIFFTVFRDRKHHLFATDDGS